MSDIRASLLRAAAEAGVADERFHPVRHPRWQTLLGDILDRFTVSGRKDVHRLWLWNDLKDEPTTLALGDPMETLEVLRSVLPVKQKVWFVAEAAVRTKKQSAFWLFDTDSEAILRVLGEHSLFEYYIVGRKLDWMVAENHHDVLMALGEPVASRLEGVRRGRVQG